MVGWTRLQGASIGADFLPPSIFVPSLHDRFLAHTSAFLVHVLHPNPGKIQVRGLQSIDAPNSSELGSRLTSPLATLNYLNLLREKMRNGNVRLYLFIDESWLLNEFAIVE